MTVLPRTYAPPTTSIGTSTTRLGITPITECLAPTAPNLSAGQN
jgi:hypothetical protein